MAGFDCIEMSDDEPTTAPLANALCPEPFPEDAEEAAADAVDAVELPDTCPLCDVLDDVGGNSATSDVAARIIEYEAAAFCRLPDADLFAQIAAHFNSEVVAPAQRLVDTLGATSAPEPPMLWTPAIVKRHFKRCKQLVRRKAAAVLTQAERLMDLTYSKVRCRDARTNEIVVDTGHAKLWFGQARAYTAMLAQYRWVYEGASTDTKGDKLGTRNAAKSRGPFGTGATNSYGCL